jgi:O-antigen ligase
VSLAVASLSKALLALNVAIYCSYAYLYFFNAGLTAVKPFYWYVLTISAAGFIVINGTRRKRVPGYVVAWLWLFLCHSVLSFLLSSQSEIAQQALIERIETTALLFSLAVLLLQEDAVVLAQRVLIGVVLLGCALNFLDFTTAAWSIVPGRAAGLYQNPTITGEVLVLAMAASVPLVPRPLRLPYCLLVAGAVLLTFSRAAWLMWAVAMSGLAGGGYVILRRSPWIGVLVGAGTAMGLYALLSGGLLEYLTASELGRYLTTDTFTRLGGGGAAFGDSSSAARSLVAVKAFEIFETHPWLGAGLAITREWDSSIEPHNMYLSMLAQGGVLGLAVFVALPAMLWYRSNGLGRLLVVLYALFSLATHNNLDQPAMLVFLAMIVAMDRARDDVEEKEYPELSGARGLAGSWSKSE